MGKAIQSVEPKIADLANGWMKSYGLDYKLEQESLNNEIDQALNDYFSKNGGVGGNRPDAKLLLQDKNLTQYPVLIEYKGYKDKLIMLDSDGKVANKNSKNQPDFKNINSYAVNGAVHYANALLHYTSYTDIIAIGMTGFKNDVGELEYEIGVYYVSKSNFGIGQKVDDYTDFSFLKKDNFDSFIEKVKRLQLLQNLALYLKNSKNTKSVLLYMASIVYKGLSKKYSWGNSISKAKIKNDVVTLPITADGSIDFDFMETFIAELKAERIKELEAYLKVSGLDNCELTNEEERALKNFKSLKWATYNLEKLFGKSTRGKRLKSEDRIEGALPFVTAGEAAEGISAYISNDVDVFEKNTTTIDMFGSAKYRNYQYGADDHVAVVHTETIPMKTSIFLTSAIHKASHTGKFDYGHNFYAKDADALDIFLPTKDGNPNYEYMETVISAIQKLVIKDVVKYTGNKMKAYNTVVENRCDKKGSSEWHNNPLMVAEGNETDASGFIIS